MARLTAGQNILKIELLKTANLIPYINNSRTHSEEQVNQIAASIQEFGFNNPILIDADNGVIAGHGRIMAAKKLGIDELPCVRLEHLSEAQKKAYIIADNKLALNADWDFELLQIEIENLKEMDFDIDLLGFDESELSEFEATADTKDGLTDDDEIPEPPEDPVSVLGDVWLLGKHRLMCGDSCSQTAIEKLMCGELADIWLTDPPYNVAYEGKTKDALTIKNDQMGDGDFRIFLRDSYATADTVMKQGGCSIFGTPIRKDITLEAQLLMLAGRFVSVLFGERTR